MSALSATAASAARVLKRRCCTRSSVDIARRAQSSQSGPHAYLTPLPLDGVDQAEELEGTMCLVMDRKGARNALSVRMVHEMRDGIAKVSSSSSARILLLHTPHEGMFCAGADLKERATMSPGQVSDFLDSLRALMGELEALSIPTLGIVDGFAMGGGTELALACDLRVGGPSAKFSLPETKLGIIPGAGGTQRLTKLVGPSTAKELIFTGRRVDAVEAERIRLLNILAQAPISAWQAGLLLSRQILTSAPLALRAAKTAINSAPDMQLQEGLDLERKVYNTLLDTEDRQEGLRAFAEKRRARFQGR